MKRNLSVPKIFSSALALLLSLALALPSAWAEGSRFTSTTADVAAWNLAGFNAIPRDKVPQFARAILDLDPEVIALVEVNPDWVAGELIAELIGSGSCYMRTLLEQTARQNL